MNLKEKRACTNELIYRQEGPPILDNFEITSNATSQFIISLQAMISFIMTNTPFQKH